MSPSKIVLCITVYLVLFKVKYETFFLFLNFDSNFNPHMIHRVRNRHIQREIEREREREREREAG